LKRPSSARARSAATTKRPVKRPATRTRRAKPTPELAAEYYARLSAAYPDAHCALDHRNAYELLVATILSAQCTDARVNMVTPALFAKYPTAHDLAEAEQEDVEELIKSTGFFRNKAKSLLGMARALVALHGGEVPRTMEELTRLPGVGRKTANVILGNAFGMNEGVVVDTHVTRLSNLLGLTRESDAVKIEQDLVRLFPRERWTMLSHLLIEHGRRVCVARAPKCDVCPLADLCPSARV
jgi:endonuclease-3